MRHVVKMTHEQRRERGKLLAAEVASGQDVYDVAVKHKVSREIVYAACRLHNGSAQLYVKASVYKTVAELQNTGDSLSEIARRLRVPFLHVHRVYTNCRKHGISMKTRRRGRPETKR